MSGMLQKPDPRRDLVLERIIEIPTELVWQAWTDPECVKKWFTPAPWQTVECEIDLRPGGIFRTVMRSPEGQDFPNAGCYLEIVPNRKLVWTNSLEPGFRPAHLAAGHPCDTFYMTAIIALEPLVERTRYTAMVLHGSEEDCNKHRELGFQEGWGKALDQLVECMRNP